MKGYSGDYWGCYLDVRQVQAPWAIRTKKTYKIYIWYAPISDRHAMMMYPDTQTCTLATKCNMISSLSACFNHLRYQSNSSYRFLKNYYQCLHSRARGQKSPIPMFFNCWTVSAFLNKEEKCSIRGSHQNPLRTHVTRYELRNCHVAIATATWGKPWPHG